MASSTEHGEYISLSYALPKNDNKVRLILNLKRLNEHVKSYYFNVDSIHTAHSLVTDRCWMASHDLKDAHYGDKILDNYQKFLKLSPLIRVNYTNTPFTPTDSPHVQ